MSDPNAEARLSILRSLIASAEETVRMLETVSDEQRMLPSARLTLESLRRQEREMAMTC